MKKKKNNKQYTHKGFLESLKDLGGNLTQSVKEDVVSGMVQEAADQITPQKSKGVKSEGVLNPDQSFDLEEYISQKEKEAETKQRWIFERKRTQERLVWTAEQQKTLRKIKAVQAELRRLVEEAEGLDQEVKTAATKVIVEPGVYHLNFLERLLEFIKLLRKRVKESKTWLAEWNAYCKKKRNYYWRQVKKSGTKFMLSSERYMATQAG